MEFGKWSTASGRARFGTPAATTGTSRPTLGDRSTRYWTSDRRAPQAGNAPGPILGPKPGRDRLGRARRGGTDASTRLADLPHPFDLRLHDLGLPDVSTGIEAPSDESES